MSPNDSEGIRPARSDDDLYEHVLGRAAAIRRRRRQLVAGAAGVAAALVFAVGSAAALAAGRSHHTVVRAAGGGTTSTQAPTTAVPGPTTTAVPPTSTTAAPPTSTTTAAGRPGPAAGPTTTRTTTPSSTTTTTMPPSCAASDLDYTVTSDRPSYPPQTTVQFILTERNHSARPCTVVTDGCGEGYVQVFAADGTKVWDSSHPPGIYSCPAGFFLTLQPGQSHSAWSINWDQRDCPTPSNSSSPCSGSQVAAGTYTAKAWWYSWYSTGAAANPAGPATNSIQIT